MGRFLNILERAEAKTMVRDQSDQSDRTAAPVPPSASLVSYVALVAVSRRLLMLLLPWSEDARIELSLIIGSKLLRMAASFSPNGVIRLRR
jgi:hypothetical protein